MNVRSKFYNTVGVVILLASCYSIAANLLFISRSAEVTGVVIGHKEGGGGGFPSRGAVYYPIIRLVCCSNNEIEIVGAPGANPPAYATGESVQVLLDESNPEDAKIYSLISMWLLPFTGLGLGLFFISGVFK